MAVMISYDTLFRLAVTPVAGGNGDYARYIGDIQIAETVQHATNQIHGQHKQNQCPAHTARNGEAEIAWRRSHLGSNS